MATFLVIFGLAAMRTFSATPIYEATAEILIDVDSPNPASLQEAVQMNRRALDYFQTQYRLLTSRSLVRQALEDSKLITEPAFAAGAQTEDAADEGDSAATSVAIRRFLAALTVTPIRNSRLVNVTFASPNPAIAQRGANAIVDAFIKQTADLRATATKDASSFLSQVLADQKKAVEASELELQKYRERGDAASLDDRQSGIVERMAKLNEAVTLATTDRIQKENIYKQVQAATSEDAKLAAVPAAKSNGTLQQLNEQIASLTQRKAELSQRIGPNHPDMLKVTEVLDLAKQRRSEEIAKILAAVASDYKAAVDLERAMSDALERDKAEALTLNRRGLDFGVLQRDAATNRQLYDTLLARSKQSDIAEQVKTTEVRTVDAAELPMVPSRPQHFKDLLYGFLLATVLALGLVFSIEAFDTRIKSPEDVTQRLKIACLGMVPLCDTGEFPNGRLLIDLKSPDNFMEAFRSLRTSVLFSSAERGGRSLLVSSTAPGEGKTLVSCNLAMALAMAGRRVLLVDADMRRPKVNHTFNCDLSPGLSNVLVGETQVESAIRPSGHDNLFLMTAGTLPPNPPELLGSSLFVETLQTITDQFDWVVIDSPPVRAVSDATVIAHLTTAVVFVVGSEMTAATSARSALDRLQATQGKVSGVVLNRVQLRRHGYYYGRYYNRADEKYYSGS